MRLSDFDYVLPPDRIAQSPLDERSASRLLHLRAEGGGLQDRMFTDLPALLDPADLIVFNDTRVIKARLQGTKQSGGRVEVLVERITSHDEALVQLGASKPSREGTRLVLAEGAVQAEVLGREGSMYRLRFLGEASVLQLLEQHGSLPLPPYISHAPDAVDARRYQTVFASEPGAVAAPTAGLHFDAATLAALAERGVQRAFVTLHVGAGTFQPVREEDLSLHRMHAERYRMPEETARAIAATRERGGRVVAVGTTVMRTLESCVRDGKVVEGEGETSIFITPGFAFQVVDRLVTNFHLPKSTLLMLVSAFAGVDEIRAAYSHAIAAGYRFFSYGDAMLLERRVG